MNKTKRLQLFIIPFAGESAGAFKALTDQLSPDIDPVVIEYPGHGKRLREKAPVQYDMFLQDVAECVAARRDASLPCAVLGYSMGTNLAFDLIARGAIAGEVLHFFPCARRAVDEHTPGLDYHSLSDEDFQQQIIQLGGIDPRLLNNKRFFDMYLRIIRGDYLILGQYQYGGAILPCDLSVIYSPQDTPTEYVSGWKHLSSGSVSFHQLGNNHFFILQHHTEMAQIINCALGCIE